MDLIQYSRQISSLIDFNTIRGALLAISADPKAAFEPSSYILGSPLLENADEWELFGLITDYFKHFKIPEESIDLVVKCNPAGTFNPAAVALLKNYKFSGELIRNPVIENAPQDLALRPLVTILTQSFIIDLLHHPLNFIFAVVESFAATWLKMREIGARAFLEPSSASELLAYMESRVARRYALLEQDMPGEKAGNAIFNGYRYNCITAELPVDERFFKVGQEISVFQAASTRK